MTNVMLKLGFDSGYITNEYGIISGYAFPLLLLPGFFANAFGRVLLHPIASLTTQNNKKEAKKLLINMTSLSLFIGLIASVIMFFFSKELMLLLYKNSIGSEYVKIFAFPFILYYIESPLINTMTALNKTKRIMIYDTITSIIRVLLLVILLPNIGMYAVGVTTVVSASLLVILMLFDVISFFRKD